MTTYHQLSAISRLLASLRTFGLQDPAPTLPPPRIPIAEGNGGIRLKDISDPQVPVRVVISAYPQMQVNDNIQLFWNNRFVNHVLVNAGHLDQGSVTIDVPSLAIQDGTPPVHYLVTSPNGQNTYKSHPLDIRVKTNVPGGTDPIPSTPEVNENLLAVTGVPELIDESNADSIVATVPRYENMTEGDKLKLSWGGYFVEQALAADDVDKPVRLAVPRRVIEQAGAGPVVIEYEIRDVVNNWSLWSIKFTPDVEVGDDLLRAPEALDLIEGVLDLAELGEADARVRVRVYADMAEGDVVSLSWIGRPPTGGPITHDDEFTVDLDSDGLPIEFPVPNAKVKASAGGSVAIKYTVTSSRGEQHSRRASFEVVGQVQQLPQPSVKEAQSNELDPQRIPDLGATVIILPYLGMASGDKVELFVSARDANGGPSSHDDNKDITGGQVDKTVEFIVPKAFFEPLINGSVDVHYRVNGEASDKLELQVVGQGGAELVAPSVIGVVEGVLDPDTVPAGTKAMVPNYQGKAVDDRIILSWAGLPGASYSDYIDVNAANLGSPIGFDIAYTPYIIGNLNGSVAVSYRVTRASGGTASSLTLPVQVQRQADETLVPPTVLEAPNGTLDPLQALNGATVRVEYDGMLTTHNLAVSWAGTNDANTWESTPKPGSAFGYVDFPVPVSVVAASQGKSITVMYAVERNDSPEGSLPLELLVNELTLKDLPEPVVPQANQDTRVLALESLIGDASVTVAPWPLIAERQRVWIKIEGTLENGSAHTFYPANGVSVTAEQVSQGMDISVPRTELEKLKHAADMTVTTLVAFDQTGNEALATEFRPASYKLEKLDVVTPTIDSVKDDAGNTVAKGGSTTSTTLVLTGKASIRQQVQILDGANVKQTVPTDANGNWTSTLTSLSTANHSFTAKALYASNPVSAAWAVTVLPKLDFGSDYTFTASQYVIDKTKKPAHPPLGAKFTRAAQGGAPPYTYTSADTSIASVNSTSGQVTVWKNGTVRMSVTDSKQNQAHYDLRVSNVKTVQYIGQRNDWTAASQYARQAGGQLPTKVDIQALYNIYSQENADVATLLNWTLAKNHPTIPFGVWLIDNAGGSNYWFMNVCNVRTHDGNFQSYGPSTAQRPILVMKT
ncbi:hypothetical protein IAE37_003962 [Pseudomonas sp. S31]|uniref:hypothetical protein n=1 Tax=Pseudomonas sp. S31 TaxID=1564473 RepID=UPI0019133A19|nr:hypothetical protein [Pseudomonas sp. S31]MBK5001686.1 hypothetical protein [Pseudomonas sp. S31]